MTFEMLKRFAKFMRIKWDVSSGAIRIAEPPDFHEEYVTIDWDIRPNDVLEFSKIEGLCFTTEKPTTPGFYWLRNWSTRWGKGKGMVPPREAGPVIVHFSEKYGVEFFGDEVPADMDLMIGEWAGPLEPPA